MANILLINTSWRPTYKNFFLSYDIVGFTDTTLLFPQLIQLYKDIKKISPSIFTVGGGSHCLALPEKSTIKKIIKMIMMKGG